MTINVTAVNDDPTGAPVITGAARVGQTLSASRTGIGDVDGLPANESDYAYQWVRVDGGTSTDITGATSRTYEVAAADEGTKLKVEVSYTDDGGTPEEVASAETATVGTNTAPVAANSAVETAEDTSYTFQATGRDVLTGSSFTLTEGSEESGFASLWGRGAISSFDGREGDLRIGSRSGVPSRRCRNTVRILPATSAMFRSAMLGRVWGWPKNRPKNLYWTMGYRRARLPLPYAATSPLFSAP